MNDEFHVVVVGGGFGGLRAVRRLRGKKGMRVTLVDRRNFHLFQPLLYQVATGGLSPGDIAYPLRAAVGKNKNVSVLAAEVLDVLPDERRVILNDGELGYDCLIVAAGARNHYFGREEWGELAPALKSVEDALEIRRRVLLAFEAAEREEDERRRQGWLTFVIVGGGSTGVELAGAIAGLAHETLVGEFRRFDTRDSRIILLEGASRILAAFPESLAAKGVRALERRGVEVRTGALVREIDQERVTIFRDGVGEEMLEARTVLWAAGVRASLLAERLAGRTGAELDRMGRLVIEPDLSLKGYPHILVVGDMGHFEDEEGRALPGVAQVAMQQGDYAGRLVLARLKGRELERFHYRDKGSMAVIGRSAAVADLWGLHLNGLLAWLIWLFVHISFLIGFNNKVLVLIQWAWAYFTRRQGARLITGEELYPRL